MTCTEGGFCLQCSKGQGAGARGASPAACVLPGLLGPSSKQGMSEQMWPPGLCEQPSLPREMACSLLPNKWQIGGGGHEVTKLQASLHPAFLLTPVLERHAASWIAPERPDAEGSHRPL